MRPSLQLDTIFDRQQVFFYTTYRQIFWLFYWITSEWILLNFEQICHNDLSKLTIISVPFLTYNRLSQMDIFEVENLKCKKKGIKIETIQTYFQHDFGSVLLKQFIKHKNFFFMKSTTFIQEFITFFMRNNNIYVKSNE